MTAGADAQARPQAPARSPDPRRLAYLDGMRALAALAVALFHFHGQTPHLAAVLPFAVNRVLQLAHLGVNVFFVISGFVIAHSLEGTRYSPGFVGSFIVRRSLRLAPPYWVTLILVAYAIAHHPQSYRGHLDAPTLLAHLVYLQDILGYPNMLEVFWTLCIEVQLYITFVLLAWLGQGEAIARTRRTEVLFLLTALASAALAHSPWSPQWRATLAPWWYMFVLGAWARWSLASARATGIFWAMIATLACASFRFHRISSSVCIVTACVIYFAGRSSLVAAALGGPRLGYLGRISYSFYLLHALFGFGALRYAARFLPPSLARDLLGLGAAFVVSTLLAHALWWAVERPSMALSRRVRWRG